MIPAIRCGVGYAVAGKRLLCDLEAGHLDQNRLRETWHRSEKHDTVIAEHQAELRQQRDNQWVDMIPSRFWDASMDTLDQPAKIREQLARWNWRGPIRNLVLLGPVGCGKTFMALAVTQPVHLSAAVDQSLYDGDVFFTTVSNMLATLRPGGEEMLVDKAGGRFHADGGPSAFGSVMEFYQGVDILILDDLGAEVLTDWGLEQLNRIVDHRWSNEYPIIVTSNLTAAALKTAVGDRVYDRLRDDAVAIKLAGPSRRGLHVVPEAANGEAANQ